VKRSLLEEQPNQGEWQFQLLPLLKTFAQKQAGDQTFAHQQAINYYSNVSKPRSWETKEDVTEYLEVFYHCCSLKRYKLAFDVLWECWEFLNLRGYYTTLLEAFELLEREWEPNENEKSDFGTVLAALGDAYYNLGQFPQAIKYHQQSCQVARQINDQIREAGAFVNLGLIYSDMGQFQKAIKLHKKGLKMARQIGHQQYEANALNNLGMIYQSLGQYPKAIDYYQQSLVIKREIGDLRGEAGALINLGLVQDFMGQHQEAIELHKRGLNLARQIGYRQYQANALSVSLNF
jgi:tetratricopeptide (TPR) repeat protein